MRVLLFAGKGGVGKTTVAAATASAATAAGHKTLLVSTDAAHSLADAVGRPLGAEPVELEPGLYAEQVDTRRGLERSWPRVQALLLALLDAAGADPVQAAELTVLPGADEILALLEVREQARAGRFDLLVLDCAPTAQTVALLALPEALRWWLDRLLPAPPRLGRSRRSTGGAGGRPDEAVWRGLRAVLDALGEARALLTDPGAAVRLVLTPESVVLAESRRTLTALSLHGYRVDGVVANRVFPTDSPWAAAQAGPLAALTADFAPLPVFRLGYQPHEPIGLADLTALGRALYPGADPLTEAAAPGPLQVERTADGFALSLGLPFASRGEVDLARRGDELVITVGAHRRLLALPSALRRCDLVGAGLRDGRLVIRFVPDPTQWIRA